MLISYDYAYVYTYNYAWAYSYDYAYNSAYFYAYTNAYIYAHTFAFMLTLMPAIMLTLGLLLTHKLNDYAYVYTYACDCAYACVQNLGQSGNLTFLLNLFR